MFKALHFIKRTLVVVSALIVSSVAFAQTQITTEQELKNIASDLGGDFVLANDITLTGEWTPIGSDAAPFTGTFNGNGHAIKGLTVSGSAFTGLFGVVSNGTVKNLQVVGANVLGAEHAGIVAGRVCNGGVIDAVMTSGHVSGWDHIGGIVGDAGEGGATVSNCMSTAFINDSSYQGGGIVGWSKGNTTISNNLFLGKLYVGAWGGAAGILAFYEDGTATVTGNVCAAFSLTGNIGNESEAHDRFTHGIAGSSLNDNSILVASNNLMSAATKIYNRDGVEQDQSGMDAISNGTITSVADLQTPATYTNLGWGAAWSLAAGRYPVLNGMSLPFDGDYIYTVAKPEECYAGNTLNTNAQSSVGRTVTVSSSNANVVSVSGTTLSYNAPGKATITFTIAGDNYMKGCTLTWELEVKDMDLTIATAADLKKLSLNPSGNFKLTADIDMEGVEFTPISSFSGSIDGQGHYIRNLTFENPNTDLAAFIATFDGTEIKNLGIEDARIIGNANTAVFIGRMNAGTLRNCVVSNSFVQGRDHVASFVGDLNGGTITDCLSNAECETRQYQLGGIAGVMNAGLIQNTLFCGVVNFSGSTSVTGIVGLLDSDSNPSTIQNCVAAPVVAKGATTGLIINLAGRQMTLSNNFVTAYTLLNGAPVSGNNDADGANGGNVSQEDARSQDWYTSTLGWDFDNNWKFLPDAEGKMLPVLKWMNTPLKTRLFNNPDHDGVTIKYIEGNESYEYSAILGSWGQNVTVTPESEPKYTSVYEDEYKIFAGSDDGSFLGAGSDNYLIVFDESIKDYFTLVGENVLTINVVNDGEVNHIATAEDLLKIVKNPMGEYVLDNDIDFEGANFAGLGNDKTEWAFTGKIDGQGHSIKNFSIDLSAYKGASNKGFFAKTMGAEIKNIGFLNFTINPGGAIDGGVNHVGLIGQGSATMEQVAVMGEAYGDDHVGLVAGDADGITMTNCYASGAVEGRSQVGGYFGCTLEGGADVQKCYSNVEVVSSRRGWAGGFIGLVDKSNSEITIKNCVSIGSASSPGEGTDHVTAPFIAGNGANDANAKIFFSDNIYNSAAKFEAAGEAWPSKNETLEGGSVMAATVQSPTGLQTPVTYTNIGWDFSGVWSINASSVYKYPVLNEVPVSEEILTGVEDVFTEAPATGYTISVANNAVVVNGLTQAATIEVYNAVGQKVGGVATLYASAAVTLPGEGLYVVKVTTGNTAKSYKVINK